MSDVLTRINADKRALVASRKAARPLSEVEAAARAATEADPPARLSSARWALRSRPAATG